MTWGWRDRLVLTAGFLVLVSSLLPWWELRERIGVGGKSHDEYHDGNAWVMSTRWSIAIVIVVAVVAVWALWRSRASVPLAGRLVLAAVTTVGVYLVLAQWSAVDVVSDSPTREVITIEPAPPTDPIIDAWMQRDQLRSYHSAGLSADVTWGLWVGLGAMLVVLVGLLVAGRRTPVAEPSALGDDGTDDGLGQ
jgi:hypothetical protein